MHIGSKFWHLANSPVSCRACGGHHVSRTVARACADRKAARRLDKRARRVIELDPALPARLRHRI